MFHSISWQSYWTAVAAVSLVYYFSVYILYFRKRTDLKAGSFAPLYPQGGDTSAFTTGAKRNGIEHPTSLHDQENAEAFSVPEDDSNEAVVYSCIDELKAFMEQAKKIHWVKEELLFALTSILKKYPSIKNSSYRQSVTNVLTAECQHHCSVHLSAEEMAQVWLDV